MVRMLAACAVLTSLFAGCAQVPTGVVDSDRLHNAVAMDDVGFVADAIQSGKLGVNYRIRAPGYRDGAPLVTVAARNGSLRVLSYLISARADVNARTDIGE